MQTPKRDQTCKTIDKDNLLQWTLDINVMEKFVYMNRVNIIMNQNSFSFVISSRATLNEILMAKNNHI